MNIMQEKAMNKIRDNAPDGAMSYQDYRQLMSWQFRLNKQESKKLLAELQEMGLVQLGNHGFKLLGVYGGTER